MNKKSILALVALVVAVVLVVVACLWGGRQGTGGTDPTGEPTLGTEVTEDTGGTEVTEDTGGEETGEGTEPDETEPEETVETEPIGTDVGATETDESEPDATEDEETEPTGTDVGVTEPEETEAEETEPEETVGTEPTGTDVGATEPEETEPVETEPVETEPEATEDDGPSWDGSGGSHEDTKPDDGEDEPEETKHKHDTERTWVDATCEDGGYYHFECACGYFFDDYREDELGHDWSDWEIIVEPTETSEGQKTCVCSRCEQVITEVIPVLDPETGLPQESYVDPRIEVEKADDSIGYMYNGILVVDKRPWDAFLSVSVNGDESLTVIFYQQDGTKVETSVEVPPVGATSLFEISSDGTYVSGLFWGWG